MSIISSYIQILIFLLYLMLNIVSVGSGNDNGVGELFLILSLLLFILSSILTTKRKYIYISFWFFIFLLFFIWFCIKITVDIKDPIGYIKEISIGTTGGILLFLFLGGVTRNSLANIIAFNFKRHNVFLPRVQILFIMMIFSLSVTYALWDFYYRLRDDTFLILDIEGMYQRPGNFSSISFLILSSIYFMYFRTGVKRSDIIVTIFYFYISCSFIVFTQMFGSNSSTFVTACTFFITLVLSGVLKKYDPMPLSILNLPFLIKILIKSIKYLFILSISLLMLLLAFPQYLVDLENTRLFGFGSGDMSSLTSRMAILKDQFFVQTGYAPILGNMNVEHIASGSSGVYLHNFFPYIFSHLGIIGLLLIMLFYGMIIYRLTKIDRKVCSFENIFNPYAIILVSFLILFANISVTVSWIVLWFAIGLYSSPFRLTTKSKQLYKF